MNFKTVLNKELPFIKENEYYFQMFVRFNALYLIKIIKIREKRIIMKRTYFTNRDLIYNFKMINTPDKKSDYIDGEYYFMNCFFRDYATYKLNQFNYISYTPY
jgi:hypothetical protein